MRKGQFESVGLDIFVSPEQLPEQRFAEADVQPAVAQQELETLHNYMQETREKAYRMISDRYETFSALETEQFMGMFMVRRGLALTDRWSTIFASPDDATIAMNNVVNDVVPRIIIDKLVSGTDPDPERALERLSQIPLPEETGYDLTHTIFDHLSEALVRDTQKVDLLLAIADRTVGSITIEYEMAEPTLPGFVPEQATKTQQVKITLQPKQRERGHKPKFMTMVMAISVAASSILQPIPSKNSASATAIEQLVNEAAAQNQPALLPEGATKADLQVLINQSQNNPNARAVLAAIITPDVTQDPERIAGHLATLRATLPQPTSAPRQDMNADFFVLVADETLKLKSAQLTEPQMALAQQYAELLKAAARNPEVLPKQLQDLLINPDETVVEDHFLTTMQAAVMQSAGAALEGYNEQGPVLAALYANLWSIVTPTIESKNEILAQIDAPVMPEGPQDEQTVPSPEALTPAPTELTADQAKHIDALTIDDGQKEFMKKFLLAVMAARHSGATVSFEVVMAQAIHESNWGRSKLAREGNNFFGMKATPEWDGPTIEILSGEHRNGQDTMEKSVFKKYGSFEESLSDYILRITGAEHYADAARNHADIGLYIDGLLNKLNPDNSIAIGQGQESAMSYALDPNYKAKIIRTIESYDLSQLIHVLGQPVPAPAPAEKAPANESTMSPSESLSLGEQIQWLEDRMTVSAEGYKAFSVNTDHMGVFDNQGKETINPEFMIMHWTGTPNAIASVDNFIAGIASSEKSVQYYIDKDGSTYQFMPNTQKARQAKGFNSVSVGVEINATAIAGPNGYTPAEMDAMVYTTYRFQLDQELEIGRASLFGHSEKTVSGKIDPPKELVDMIGRQIKALHTAMLASTAPATAKPTPAPSAALQVTPPVTNIQGSEEPESSANDRASENKELAAKVMVHPNISFDQSPNDRVRESVRDLIDDGLTFKGDVGNNDKKEFAITPTLLKAALEMADAGIKVQINSLTTGKHGSNSHGKGYAIDLGIVSQEDIHKTITYLYENRERLGVDELIFGGDMPEGTHNLDRGQHHNFNKETLDGHKGHVHLMIK